MPGNSVEYVHLWQTQLPEKAEMVSEAVMAGCLFTLFLFLR